MSREQEPGKKERRSALLHLYLVLKGGAPPATEKQMYTGKETRDTRVACGDVSSWTTPWTTKGEVLHGSHSRRMHNHAGNTGGIRGVQRAAGSEPRSLPRPTLLGACSWTGTAPWSGTDTAPASPADTSYSLQGCSARIRSHWNRECGGGSRGTTCASLRSTRAGGEAPSSPARLRKARSRRLCIQREGHGSHADLAGSHEAGGRSVQSRR